MEYRTGVTFKKILIFVMVVFGSIVFTAEEYCHSQHVEKNGRPFVTNIPNVNNLFVGRQEHLQKLQEKLNMQKMPGIIAIVGMAGMGKTQLARQYAHAHVNDHDVIWWIDA